MSFTVGGWGVDWVVLGESVSLGLAEKKECTAQYSLNLKMSLPVWRALPLSCSSSSRPPFKLQSVCPCYNLATLGL